MRGLRNERLKPWIIVSAGLFIAAVLVMICVFAPSSFEHIQTFTTADNAHKIVMYASYPTAPTNARATIKMVCSDNITGEEVEVERFELVIPKKGEWFSLVNDAAQKCSVIVHDHRGDKKMELVWSEIFT